MLFEKLSSGPLQTNAYLVGCERTHQAVLIDAPFGCCEEVLKILQKRRAELTKLLLTHSHWDHFADARALQDATGAQVLVHREDAQNVKAPGSDQLPMMCPVQPIGTIEYLVEGQEISVGDLLFEIIHTPGHSPGGVCLYLRKERILFSGDTLFKGCIGSLSLPTANAEAMWHSLKKLSKLPEETKVFPGHGKETTLKKEDWLARAKEIFE